MLRFTVLGCGSSAGTPVPGCHCEVCSSQDPRNQRLRSALHVSDGTTGLLIDTGPDCRQQLLRHSDCTIDAVFWTHAHADHSHGIDDLRSLIFRQKRRLPSYASQATFEDFYQRFGYCFRQPDQADASPLAVMDPRVVEAGETVMIGSLPCRFFQQHHGRMDSLGIRIGNVAYSTDVKAFPESSTEVLEGLDLWFVDCLSYLPNPTHSHLEQTLEWITRWRPKQAILIHMAHDIAYESIKMQLPSHVRPAYDGLVIDIPV
jgi:phosphoribosyl 1,2-cyclic phosphate phosphodiesterase